MTDIYNIFAAKNQQQKTLELLTRAFPDNDALQEEVGNLIETKELWKKRLTKVWNGRKRPVYTQWMVRDMNFAFKQMSEADRILREAQNIWEYNQVNERSWVIKERSASWRGWDPFSSSYMQEALEYEDTPDWEVAKHSIIKEEKSGAIDIIASMRKLIDFGEKMGFGDVAFEQLFLMFAKHELKEALAGITRFSGDVDKVFASIASLIHGDYEEAKIRNTLRLMVRPAHESLSIIMNKVMSCFMALYAIKHQNMLPERQKSRVEAHCIDAITTVITPECKSVYERYRRTMVDNGEVFSLLEIVDFISTVETSNVNCSWQVAKNLLLAVSTLDYNSLALDVKTDMAIHMSQMAPTNQAQGVPGYSQDQV